MHYSVLTEIEITFVLSSEINQIYQEMSHDSGRDEFHILPYKNKQFYT